MNILALDTATERCSAALLLGGRTFERSIDTPRGHAELIPPMIEQLLAEAAVALAQLDCIAYGRGPGAFTGVRIGVGVAQGLAFGARLATVGVSNLAAVAQQVAQPGDHVLVCMDARMNEVYWGEFERPIDDSCVRATSEERVSPAALVSTERATVLAGTGLRAYPQLAALRPGARVNDAVLPHAREVAQLAVGELQRGGGLAAAQAEPVYLRDQVAFVKAP